MGGLIGDATSGTTYITDCYNEGEIKSKGSGGGLVGSIKGVNITHCYNFGNISTELSTGIIGGLVASNYNGAITDCVNYCDLTGPSSGSPTKGEIAGKNTGTLTLNHCYYSGMYKPMGNGTYTGTAYELGGDRDIIEESWYTTASNWTTPWDLTNTWIWQGSSDQGYPDLRVFYPTTLTVNPNGGVFSGSPNRVSYSQHIGETRTLPVPTRAGYTFKGWRAVGTTSGIVGNLGKLTSDNRVFASKDNVAVYGSETTFTNEATTLQQTPYNTQVLKISSTGECTFENRKGFTFNTQSYADAEFIAIFEAKIPVGYKVHWGSNQCGGTNWDGVKSGWLTSQEGTGDWETYAYYVKCWPASTGGSYDGTNYFFFEGPAGTASNPVNVYLAQASVYDCTGMNLNTNTIMSNLTKDARYTYGTSDTILVAMWESDVWTRHAATSFAGGDGSASNPYQIANASQLAKLAVMGQSQAITDNYVLTADINLSGHEWVPIGIDQTYRLFGTFDGKYHTISNMKITSIGNTYANGYCGLFATVVSSGIVKNLIIQDADITSALYSGAIAGLVDNINDGAGIYNCIVKASRITGENIGGIAGWSWNSIINNCMVINVTLNGSGAIGAIFGSGGGAGRTYVMDNGAYWISIINDRGGSSKGAIYGTASPGENCFDGSYVQYTHNGTISKLMFGDSTKWGNWTYNSSINNGYPVQTGMFWIGGQSGSTNVYNYLKNTLGFTVC